MLRTDISDISLRSCIYNSSGCWCTSIDELDQLMVSSSGAVISKSNTVSYRDGNEKPRLYLGDNISINSMGVPNLGYETYTEYGNRLNSDKPYMQSIIPFSIDDLKQIISSINNNISAKRGIEVNLSCPNIINKRIVGYDYEIFNKYLSVLDDINTDNLVLGIKLPPYYELWEFDRVSNIIKNHPKIRFITCINSLVNGLIVDFDTETTAIRPKGGFGGIGGSAVKPIALSNVNNFYKRLGDIVDIVGCGGVINGKDIFEHILCGASAVQVGTKLMIEGPKLFDRLNKELINIMKDKGYDNIADFKGKLKVR